MPAKKKNDLKDEKATLASLYKAAPKAQPKVEPKAQPKAPVKAPAKANKDEIAALDKQIAELEILINNGRTTVFRRQAAQKQHDVLVQIRDSKK